MNLVRLAAGVSFISLAACDPFATPEHDCADCYSAPYPVVANVEAFPRMGYENSQHRVVLGGQLAEDSRGGYLVGGGLPFRWGYISTYQGYAQSGGFSGDTLYKEMKFLEAVPKAAVDMKFSISLGRSDSRIRDLGMAEGDAAPPECKGGLHLSSPMDEEHRRVELVFGTKMSCETFLDRLTNTASSTRMTLQFAFLSAPPIERISVEGVDVVAPAPAKQ